MHGKYLACYLAALLFSSARLPPAACQDLTGARHAYQGSQRQNIGRTKLNWTLYRQGYFSRARGLFFVENDHLHVYGEVRATRNPQTNKMEPSRVDSDLKPRWKGEPYSHEIYDLVNGKWDKTLQEFSQRPEHYLDFGSCDVRDEIDLANSEIKKAFWPWPGTEIRVKDVTNFPPAYATIVYSKNRKGEAITPQPDDRTLEVALVVHGTAAWRLRDGIDITNPPVCFCGTRTLSTTEDGERHPVLLVFSIQGEDSVLGSYLLD